MKIQLQLWLNFFDYFQIDTSPHSNGFYFQITCSNINWNNFTFSTPLQLIHATWVRSELHTHIHIIHTYVHCSSRDAIPIFSRAIHHRYTDTYINNHTAQPVWLFIGFFNLSVGRIEGTSVVVARDIQSPTGAKRDRQVLHVIAFWGVVVHSCFVWRYGAAPPGGSEERSASPTSGHEACGSLQNAPH